VAVRYRRLHQSSFNDLVLTKAASILQVPTGCDWPAGSHLPLPGEGLARSSRQMVDCSSIVESRVRVSDFTASGSTFVGNCSSSNVAETDEYRNLEKEGLLLTIKHPTQSPSLYNSTGQASDLSRRTPTPHSGYRCIKDPINPVLNPRTKTNGVNDSAISLWHPSNVQ
jgi:hypothetical protein